MYIHGHFYNEQNECIEVHIVTRNDRTRELEIGAEGSGINWTDAPVEIESQVSDTFDVLLKYQASVRLLVKNFIPDLFCASCRDAIINIYREGECLFAGFIEPQSYSQPYNEEEDEIELSCIDVLTALQYSKYRNVGMAGVTYAAVKAAAKQRSFYAIINEVLADMTSGLDILGGHDTALHYAGSMAVDIMPARRYDIFSRLAINELLFLGDEEDNVWTAEDVLTELLKYLSLHIIQTGFSFHVFLWESVKRNEAITWKDLIGGQTVTVPHRQVDITTANVVGTDTTINIGEVYNRLQLTCKVEKMDSLVESPLEESALRSYFIARQKYMTELVSWGTGNRALDGFKDLVMTGGTGYDAGNIIDWYVWIKRHPEWRFPMHDGTAHAGEDLAEHFGRTGKNQHDELQWLGKHLGAALVAYGKVFYASTERDNSPIAKIDMTDALVLSVNGNGSDDQAGTYPAEADLHAAIPYAVYQGNRAGGVFSPADDETTNYIVLSGKMLLNPLAAQTAGYRDLRTKEWVFMPLGGPVPEGKVPVRGRAVPDRNGNYRYYTRKFWKQTDPDPKCGEEPAWDEQGEAGWFPFVDSAPEQYEFKYSAVGDETDKISKVGLVACMLIIGDKCVVETGSGSQIEDFSWRKYKERSECASDDEYYAQSFTIGFDPKLGDRLIGREYALQNNISWKRGVATEGMAIPVRKGDHVSGPVRFIILGPVNVLWSDITRRHPTFFRHTKWTENAVPLLAHVSSIQIKEFEIKVASDNGLVEHLGDEHDIVYMSAVQTAFCNPKDDIEFKITSALTREECIRIGVTNGPALSTPVDTDTGDGVQQLFDHSTTRRAKPEQLYIDSCYGEWHAPRVVMTQRVTDVHGGIAAMFVRFRHNFMNKTFFVQGLSRNLAEGTAELTLKEIEHD